MSTERTIYTVRRENISREESAMIRGLIESHLQAIKNWTVSAVDCGDGEYGKSGQTGYETARKLVKELHKYQAMLQTFPPDSMWID